MQPLSTPPAEAWLQIGKIVGVQGLQGELRVYPDTDFPERFEIPGTRWLLRPGATQPEPIELKSGRYLDGKGLYIVRFAGVSDRAQAEALRDCQILVPKDDRPSLEAGEFHVADLLGLEVFDQATQQSIGTVIEIFAAGNDLLQVKLHDDRQVLIPFVEAIVPVVDLVQRRIEITPPTGLIEP
ncbi:MAG: ribosome maturation factor RimM [Oscillatoriophycideae cyanobacterium NC_groundwater_1537_Pr4_S-0.65um_50_18]|nr:ribosome maturation factor RimM [Oscillatoriophycideae cyanobacterium NC_groundwater_1537_Pr4_S-0.65um_50_18]